MENISVASVSSTAEELPSCSRHVHLHKPLEDHGVASASASIDNTEENSTSTTLLKVIKQLENPALANALSCEPFLCSKDILSSKCTEKGVDNVEQVTNALNEVSLNSSSLSNGVAHELEESESEDIVYVSYKSELQMPDIMRLIQKDLSEPYSIYTYRYFIHNWPKLCFLAMYKSECVGAIVCKLDIHRKAVRRGYIAMLAVDQNYRKRKIGSNLVLKAIRAMAADDADEVVLETEITNKPALRLYENLGFVRDKRLFRYYLNGVDALRLKLWLR